MTGGVTRAASVPSPPNPEAGHPVRGVVGSPANAIVTRSCVRMPSRQALGEAGKGEQIGAARDHRRRAVLDRRGADLLVAEPA
jgi:hypothetical protein